jgi:hypothetical protein
MLNKPSRQLIWKDTPPWCVNTTRIFAFAREIPRWLDVSIRTYVVRHVTQSKVKQRYRAPSAMPLPLRSKFQHKKPEDKKIIQKQKPQARTRHTRHDTTLQTPVHRPPAQQYTHRAEQPEMSRKTPRRASPRATSRHCCSPAPHAVVSLPRSASGCHQRTRVHITAYLSMSTGNWRVGTPPASFHSGFKGERNRKEMTSGSL